MRSRAFVLVVCVFAIGLGTSTVALAQFDDARDEQYYEVLGPGGPVEGHTTPGVRGGFPPAPRDRSSHRLSHGRRQSGADVGEIRGRSAVAGQAGGVRLAYTGLDASTLLIASLGFLIGGSVLLLGPGPRRAGVSARRRA